MAITITEKQHWKERIEARINRRIDHLKSSDISLFEQIEEQAKAEAIANAKLTKEFAKLGELDKAEAKLKQERDDTLSIIHRRLYGRDDSSSSYYIRSRIDEKIRHLQAQHQERLLLNHELGREIAKLNTEKENLLDTVWLATSPKQVTDLWQKVANLLGEQTTEFQREVLTSKLSPV